MSSLMAVLYRKNTVYILLKSTYLRKLTFYNSLQVLIFANEWLQVKNELEKQLYR